MKDLGTATEEAKSSTIFYGWLIVAACFAIVLTLGGSLFTFGLFLKPLVKEFGWSRALVSSGYTAFIIGYAISVIVNGRLVDRYSPRPILLLNSVLVGFGFSLCSQVQSINQLRFFLLTAGLGIGATWVVPTSTVQRWFYLRRKAGMALGIVVAGFGIGSLIFAPLINYLILSRSWRMAYLIIGFIFFVVISLSALVIKRSQTESSTVTQTNPLNSIRVRSWTAGRAMLTLPFAGITLIHCFVLVSMQTMAVHLVPYATDVGISSTVSAAAVGLLGGFSVPGRLLSGFVSERIQWQRTLALSCFGMSLVLLFLFFLKGAWMLYCFVFFYGMFHGARVSAHLGILGQFFGIGSLGELIGITEAIGIFIGSLAPYLTGYVFDTSGSYSMAFLIVMALLLLSAITASVIGKPIAPYEPRHTGL